MSLTAVLESIRKETQTERDKGTRFERLIQAFLQTDQRYSRLFRHVWLWSEFFGRKAFGGTDTGIDLVAETVDGGYWAIQCKCYQEKTVISKGDVDSFLSTSGRLFPNQEGKDTTFEQRLWISTTDSWGSNALEAMHNQTPPVQILGLSDLEAAAVDWDALDKGLTGKAALQKKKILRPHQQEALNAVLTGFETHDRGKLIMACGTGKTFTALRTVEACLERLHPNDAETAAPERSGLVLFLVPSIALLSQTLDEWCAQSKTPLNAICVCSDKGVSQRKSAKDDSDGFTIEQLALPATTNVSTLKPRLFEAIRQPGMTVVFSTYQSIETVAETQKSLRTAGVRADFDIAVCDEAHRTTGYALKGEELKAFMLVHDENAIHIRKRLYMTATPRLYSEESKSKAAKKEVYLCSMDDEDKYGPEFFRLGFGRAVKEGLLTDYKVLVLAVNEAEVSASAQKILATQNELSTDDASKLVGCINALSKIIIGDGGTLKASDPAPMRRAVAFCQTIKASKIVADVFRDSRKTYWNTLSPEQKAKILPVDAQHVDGGMSATDRQERLRWLKQEQTEPVCRILTNARCLSEGVDVPNLDAVLFLSARNSQVDVVQSVGRVMRLSDGKKYGYIIIPIVIPEGVKPEDALEGSDRYKVVWSVLSALRAHDDRFNATVNQIELNKSKPKNIIVGGIDSGDSGSGDAGESAEAEARAAAETINKQLELDFQTLQATLYAKMVEKVGERRYWENWAKDIAEIVQRHITRIKQLVSNDSKHREEFLSFVGALRKNINPSVTEQQAVEMLGQHLVTKPVFDALFDDYSFVKNNPVSCSMQGILSLLEKEQNPEDLAVLNRFYESVKERASGIDNAAGKQTVIVELYDKFFKVAFKKMSEQLGIVYTPTEVVDFIIHSVEAVMQKEFGRSISDENVHVLDPFTGTGTFMTRLLQSGVIRKEDLLRKYTKELHANEIVLLAYYIAAVNIETVFRDVAEQASYEEFKGICLTDTFQLGETEDAGKLFADIFPENSQRVIDQKKAPIRVIIGNPPYSAGQKSANDNAQNQEYPHLRERIEKTYAAGVKTTNKNSLYDSYIEAFRWATDRLQEGSGSEGGIVAFVSNGNWIANAAMAGMRTALMKEYSRIYIFDLRGNCRTSGELRKKEAGNVFGLGSRTPICITVLVKRPEQWADKPAEVLYHDIGDYLSHEEKLQMIAKFGDLSNSEMSWIRLEADEHGDWLGKRSGVFGTLIPLGNKDDKKSRETVFLPIYSNGLKTNCDSWAYNLSEHILVENIGRYLSFFNEEVLRWSSADQNVPVEKFVRTDLKQISWHSGILPKVTQGVQAELDPSGVRTALYRPFFKLYAYFDRVVNQRVAQLPKLFPYPGAENLAICVSKQDALITDCLPDLHVVGDTQCFPLYWYEERDVNEPSLFGYDDPAQKYIRHDAITDWIRNRARQQYGDKAISKENIFYYVYGLLHSKDYREAFSNDLKKMLPRIPLVDDVKDFWAFERAGRQLAELHLHYEAPRKTEGVEVVCAGGNLDNVSLRVSKMRFAKIGKEADLSSIEYNNAVTVKGIPAKAYEYVVNGKTPMEWMMEFYTENSNKKYGENKIVNDANSWCEEHHNPRYILDTLINVIDVSCRTVDIVDALPHLNLEDGNEND